VPERIPGADETLVVEGGLPPSRTTDAQPSSAASSSLEQGSGERTILALRYVILGLLGSGGMGTVYRAHDLELDELCALKVLRPEIVGAPGVLERFRREAKLARRVTHRNVARVYDIGEHEGERFLTMELVDGEPLSAAIAREGALPFERAVAMASAIAAALESAHAAGVVHLDLKPDNVVIASDGRVVVTDFGIARAVLDPDPAGNTMGARFGTPAYMAPEQVEALPTIDGRADVYAFGAVFYEMLTGKRAWPGTSPFAVASARLVSPPPDPRRDKPTLPPASAELCLRCMARLPEDRPASIVEVVAELAVIAFPPSPPPSPTLAPPTLKAAPTPVPEERPSDKTVAVLPFHNSGAAEDDYLAEELTDDLIDALSMTRGLKVRARGAVARLRGKDHDAREVGRELGVQVVAEGAVRRAGGRVRIGARLISVADGFQLWARRIERPEHEVLSINDEVARAIIEALTLEASAVVREAPTDPAAIDLYLRARHEYRSFWPEHQRRAVGLFEQAAAIAPDDPMILSGMAMALSRLSFFAGSSEKARARQAAERAVAVAPDLSESHLALGSVLLQLSEPKAAIRELRQAVGRGPGLAEAHSALGRLLVEVGAFEEGMRRLGAALELEPSVPLACAAKARAQALLEQWDEADALLERLPDGERPISVWALRARAALWRRLPSGAGEQEVPRDVEAGLIWAMGEVRKTSRLPEGMPTLEELDRSVHGGLRRRVLFFQMAAEIAAYAGEAPQVLEALRLADEAGLIDLLWLERCPLFDPFRADPRFAAVHARVKARADEILAAYRAP
jgi:serine/threonine-protein kinase